MTPPDRLRTLLLAGALLALTLAAHAPGLDGAFVYDDIGEVRDNEALDVLWPPSTAMFTGGRLPHRPLPYYSFALNRRLNRGLGLDAADVRSFHVVNLAIHVANGLLVWWLVAVSLVDFQGWTDRRRALVAGWGAALVWLVHPLVTQPVTYIYQRMELLGALAILGTLAAFAQAQRAGGGAGRWLCASVACCAAGMGCKETVVAAPALVAAFDRLVVGTPLREMARRRFLFYAALAATPAIAVAIVVAQRARYPELTTNRVTWWEYALNQPAVILHYLRLAAWPADLCFDYDWPVERDPRALWPSLLGLGVLLGAGAAALCRRPAAGFLGLGFLVTLAPTSSVMPVTHLCVEHRMYLPLAFLATAAVLGLDRLVGRLAVRIEGPALVAAAAVAAAAALGAATAQRADVYRSRVAVWAAAVRHDPGNPRAVAAVGEALYWRGDVSAALFAYERSAEIEPAAPAPHVGRAACLLRLGRPAEAVAPARRAIALDPARLDAHLMLGEALLGSGAAAAAAAAAREALEIDAVAPAAWVLLGRAALDAGDRSAAEAAIGEALRLDPHNAEARASLAAVTRTKAGGGGRRSP